MPGSTSNLGAGFDCLGLAVDRYLEATFTPAAAPLTVTRAGTLTSLDIPPGEDRLGRALTSELRRQGLAAPTGHVQVTSAIPVGRGLGSSAAATVAGLALAAAAAGRPFDPAAAVAVAWREEGHPDNAAPALLGGLVAVVQGEGGDPVPIRLPLSDAVGFAYAAPAVAVSTRAARNALPSRVNHTVAVRSLGRMAALVRGLATADPELLRLGFQDELHVPFRLPLIPGAAAVFEVACEAGAWAVTISGSGSGLIAACPTDHASAVARAMGAAFARAAGPGVIAFPLAPDSTGVHILEP